MNDDLLFFESLYCLSYSAAAVITNEEEVDGVKYLDKFTVGRQSQVRFPFSNLWIPKTKLTSTTTKRLLFQISRYSSTLNTLTQLFKGWVVLSSWEVLPKAIELSTKTYLPYLNFNIAKSWKKNFFLFLSRALGQVTLCGGK